MFGSRYRARIAQLETEAARNASMYLAEKAKAQFLRADNARLGQTNCALDRTAAKLKAERDDARAELAPLKAARERANANLRNANSARADRAALPQD